MAWCLSIVTASPYIRVDIQSLVDIHHTVSERKVRETDPTSPACSHCIHFVLRIQPGTAILPLFHTMLLRGPCRCTC
jgi:hypothetical protein